MAADQAVGVDKAALGSGMPSLKHGRWQTPLGPIAYSVVRYGTPDSGRPWALLLHGITTDRSGMLALAAALAADFDVLCIDMPCHGESLDIPPDNPGDPVAVAQPILAAITAHKPRLLQDQPVLLVGHSFGGLVAAVLARHCAGAIGLVLGDTPLTMAKQRYAAAMLRLGFDDGPVRRHAPVVRDGFGVTAHGIAEKIYYDLPLLQPAPVLVLRAALPFGSKMTDARLPSCLDDIDQAALEKFGAGKVQCRILDGTSHTLFNEAPEAAAAAIREWLAQRPMR